MGSKLCRGRDAVEPEQNEVLWVSFAHAHALDLEPLASAVLAKLASSEPAWRPALFANVELVSGLKIRSTPGLQRHDATQNHQFIITLSDGQGAPSKQDLAEVEQVVRTSFPFLDNLRLSAGREFRYPFNYRTQEDKMWTITGRTTNVHSDFRAPTSVHSGRPTRTSTYKFTFCGNFGVCSCFPRLQNITDEYE